MKKRCSLCGRDLYENTPFKAGYICEDCILYMKSSAM